MGVFSRLVHRLAGLPPPAEREDPIAQAHHEALEKNNKAAEKRVRATLALTDMLEEMRVKRGPPSKH